ncbi:hypothetical protein EG68_06013, partial [Paragonimus skrjabini miyazakii]
SRDSTLSYAHKLDALKRAERLDVSLVGKIEETFEDEEQKDDVQSQLQMTMSKGRQITPEKHPTKLEQDLMKQVLERTRENIVQPQVVGHREYHGPGFKCNPSSIWFKDFNVNFELKIKLQLINASLKASTCRFVDMTQELLDFVTIRFSPPGVLSPGMSCPLEVTFLSKLDRDLYGHLNFLTPNGPFSIPFKATTKKCEVATNTTLVDFGQVTVGECVKQQVILRNNGAKGVNFVFSRANKFPLDELQTNDERTNQHSSENFVSRTGTEEEIVVPVDNSEESQPTEHRGQSQQSIDINAGKNVDHKELKSSEPSEATLDFALDGLSEFECGDLTQGYLGPFGSVTLDIIWHPKYVYHRDDENMPILLETEKFVVQFDNPCCQPIEIFAQGTPKDLPTWLSTNTMVMGICWYDRLYQDCFAVNNRKTTALKVTFQWDSRISNHLEILPKTGYVQAQGRLLAQVKFLPRTTLVHDLQLQNTDEHPLCLQSFDLIPVFDSVTGVLHVPVAVCVAGQTNVLEMIIAAVVTSSDLTLNPNPMVFGSVEIHETVATRLVITNHSLLSQQFGIVNLPEYVDVQPNNGFGTILPKDTLELEVLFSPSKPKDYSFQITCKTGIGREFSIPCTGIGVFSPLKLSATKILMDPTPLGETNIVEFTVTNVHVSSNPYTHPQPRIGSNSPEIPVQPTAYEIIPVESYFTLPQAVWGVPISDQSNTEKIEQTKGASFLTIYPQADTLEPNQSQRVVISFTPRLSVSMIQSEIARTNTFRFKRQTIKSNSPDINLDPKAIKSSKNKRSSVSQKRPMTHKNSLVPTLKSKLPADACVEELDGTTVHFGQKAVEEDSLQYRQAFFSILRQYPSILKESNGEDRENSVTEIADDQSMQTVQQRVQLAAEYGSWPGTSAVYRLACLVANGPGSENAADLPPSFRPENTLFLEITCPIVRPALLIVSNQQSNHLDFGHLCAGQQTKCTLVVQNISPYKLQLSTTPLNPIGPFELVNTLKQLKCEGTCKLYFKFSPRFGQSWCSDSLQVLSEPVLKPKPGSISGGCVWKCPLTIKLIGKCVIPCVEIIGLEEQEASLTNKHRLDFGAVLCGEYIERQLTIRNQTEAPVSFTIENDGAMASGTNNASGTPVFMFVPNNGLILPGGSQSVSVTFAPEQTSDLFQQTFLIKLNNQLENSHTIQLSGCGKPHFMYVVGGDYFHGLDESVGSLTGLNDYLGISLQPSVDETNGQSSSYLTIQASRVTSAEQETSRDEKLTRRTSHTQRVLRIGCVRTSATVAKKSAEFVVDNITELNTRGFFIEPVKNFLDPGTEQTLVFKWVPNPDIRMGSVHKTTAKITLKADVTTTHFVHLIGQA